MPNFTMEDLLQADVAVGQGNSAGTFHDGNSSGTSRNYLQPQPTIYQRILSVTQQGSVMTRHQIADALGLRKAPWLNTAIERLAADGYLIKHESRTPQGVLMWLYEKAEG